MDAFTQANMTFAAQREDVMHASDDELLPIVEDALDAYARGEHDWYDDPVEAAAVLWHETFSYEQGRDPTAKELAEFQSTAADVLERTAQPEQGRPDPAQANTITSWLSAYALNSATAAGGGDLVWVTMHDGHVRDIHVPLNGQLPVNDVFDVAGYQLHYPGEPVGPPHVWISCRCVVRKIKEGEMSTTTAAGAPAHPELDDEPDVDDGGDLQEVDGEAYDELDSAVPWHGVLAPTGVVSGDRRKFTPDVLRHRDLPLPVKWQKVEDEGHRGSVVVANIEKIWEQDGLIMAEGMMHSSPEADEVIDLVANRMLRGFSVDLDDATFEMQNDDGTPFDLEDETGDPIGVITDGRIASVTVCAIPAFQEAYIALGPWQDDSHDDTELAAAGCAPCAAREMDELMASWEQYGISEAEWDGSAARFTPEQWYASTIVHKSEDKENKGDHALPILEPNGDLSRAGVHAAAGRVDQTDATPEQIGTAKRALITAYNKLEEDPPESLTASAFEQFAPGTHDGPGWITNPKDTQRLRTYWTRGKGAAKIRWGTPGDFNRCRNQLRKYVPNAQYLAGTCANLHKVAMGLWPGQEGGKRHSLAASGAPSPAFVLVASGEGALPPSSWFVDPKLEAPTPLTIDGDHIYGHVAAWSSCHTGLGISVGDGEVCVRPPNSVSGYAFFHTGAIATEGGPVAVGHITMDTGHAAASMPGRPAAAHYDNTGTVVADVVAGEDQHGIWFSGAVRAGVDDAHRFALQAASLSGDWRRLGHSLELVAALAVNVPGFPIPRTSVAASAAHTQSLVAAGLIINRDEVDELRQLIRHEFDLINAENARAIKRAQTRARLHQLRVEHARAQLADLARL
jgi:hypothetical protein